MATVATVQQLGKTVEYLGHDGDKFAHICTVAGETVVVRDHVTHYECRGQLNEVYRIGLVGGVVKSCTCPAQRYGKMCKHRLASVEVAKRW